MTRRVRRFLTMTIVLVAVLGMPLRGLADDSTHVAASTAYQIDPAHTGLADSAGVSLPIERLWYGKISAPSYPVIAQDRVVATGFAQETQTNVVVAFDAKTGAESWSHEIGGSYPSSNPAYADGHVFVASQDGLVRSFAADDGRQEWVRQVPNGSIESSPVAMDGTVFVVSGGQGDFLNAIEEGRGDILWSTPVRGSVTPAFANGIEVSVSGCDETHATKLSDRSDLWAHMGPCSGGGGQVPVIAGGRVYVRDPEGDLVLNLADGSSLRWPGPPPSPETLPNDPAPAFDADGHIYLVWGGDLYARDPNPNDLPLWIANVESPFVTAPIVMGDWVIAGTEDGHVYAVDRATGAEVWSDQSGKSFSPDRTQIAVYRPGLAAAGPLLVAPVSGGLVAYRAHGTWNLDGVPDSSAPFPSDSIPGAAAVSPAASPAGGGSPVGSGSIGFGWMIFIVGVVGSALVVGETVRRSRRREAEAPVQGTSGPAPPRPDR